MFVYEQMNQFFLLLGTTVPILFVLPFFKKILPINYNNNKININLREIIQQKKEGEYRYDKGFNRWFGILQRVTDAKERTDEAQIRERIQLAYCSILISGQGKITEELLITELTNEIREIDTAYTLTDNKSQWNVAIIGTDIKITTTSSPYVQLLQVAMKSE